MTDNDFAKENHTEENNAAESTAFAESDADVKSDYTAESDGEASSKEVNETAETVGENESENAKEADKTAHDEAGKAESEEDEPYDTSDVLNHESARNYTRRRADTYFKEHKHSGSFSEEKLVSEKHRRDKKEKSGVRSEAAKKAEAAFNFSSGINNKIYIVMLAILMVFDLFAMNLFMRKAAYFLSEKILIALGFETLKFTNITLDQICMGLGYFVSLAVGGLILYLLMKILSTLFVHFSVFKKSKHIPFVAVGAFALVFIIGSIVAYIVNDAFLVSNVYKWGCPAMAYIGGCISYVSSKFHVGIDY
ncbi:MAG: hypothetical protein IJZ90_03855 [Clostridia bacterium]|nr:hypothetical protein [Clostridia bacterium]